MTLALATGLFGVDGWLTGQGILSIFTIVIGVPILLLRALLAWRKPVRRRRRLASVVIYCAAAIVTVTIVSVDMRQAHSRAERVIAACEAFKAATGQYPASLAELMPAFLPTIPATRRLGMPSQGFIYSPGGGPGNQHVLAYISIPPFGQSYYVFEEGRWGFRD